MVTTVDDARLCLFLRKERNFDCMPPSSDALHQHFPRVANQSEHIPVLHGVISRPSLSNKLEMAARLPASANLYHDSHHFAERT